MEGYVKDDPTHWIVIEKFIKYGTPKVVKQVLDDQTSVIWRINWDNSLFYPENK